MYGCVRTKISFFFIMKTLLIALLLTVGLIAPAVADNLSVRPNILVIFTDDQGYGDLGCFGSETNKTPRMDKLAEEGTMFTSFYAQNVCGPSRSALLTGRYPHRSGGWGMPASEITWAELMQDVGYETICIGKWDVSDRRAIIDRMPLAQGFDYYFGPLGANDNGKVKFHENNEPAGGTSDMGSLTRLYTNKAIEFLQDKRDKEKPFVLYLSHTMMHTDIDASDRFRGTSDGGLYGDVVEEFDFETGRLLDTLDALGLKDNTLVIYTTDNGPWNQPAYTQKEKGHTPGAIFWGDSGPLRNGKGSCYEGGARVPCIIRWPGKVAAGATSPAIFATLDFLPTFANLAGFEVPKGPSSTEWTRPTCYWERSLKETVTPSSTRPTSTGGRTLTPSTACGRGSGNSSRRSITSPAIRQIRAARKSLNSMTLKPTSAKATTLQTRTPTLSAECKRNWLPSGATGNRPVLKRVILNPKK